jgi:hypothetical protein
VNRRYSTSPANFKRLRSAHVTPTGTLLTRKCVVTSAGRTVVEDFGKRWIPANPISPDAQPDSLLALARHGEAHERHVEEASQRTRRAA